MNKIGHIITVVAVFVCFNAQAQTYKSAREQENRLMDAVTAYDNGDNARAGRLLEGIAETDPDNDAAHYYLGLVAVRKADLETAEKEFRKAVSIDTTNFWYRHRLATVYSATRRPELAESIYRDLLRDFPKKSDIYYNLMELYLAEGRMDDALATLSQIETVFGKNEMTVMARFEIMSRQDRQREAYEMLEAYNRDYSSPQVLSLLGDYQMSMYNDSTAVALYDEALDIAPDYAPALLGKAEAYRITRKYDQYFKTMEEFVTNRDISSKGKADYLTEIIRRSDPNFLKAFRPQMDSLVASGVATHPKDSSMMTLSGIYFYGTGRTGEACDRFRENMLNWPESLPAAASYIELLAYADRWEELVSEAGKAAERFPEEKAFLEYSVLAAYNLKDYGLVQSLCQKIIDKYPSDSAAVLSSYSTMGDTYHLQGDNAKAYKSYDKALRINPEHCPVLNNYAYWLSLEGKKLKKAYTMSRKTVEKEPDNPTYLDTFGWILFLQGKPLEAKPFFKHAMLYGGKDSAVILDHYAEVLYALGEYDMAFIYWDQAVAKDKGEERIEGLEEKIRERKAARKK
ncbi:MAG: tetratricopeptide repeat protein [Candidatus Cryptobacteroides sp.]